MDHPHGQKRTANFSPTTLHPTSYRRDSHTPQILRRHQHRHQNIASRTWGVEKPPAPRPFSTSNPPPSHRTSSIPLMPFNIYKSLLRHPNLFFQFAMRLPHPTLVALYAIDKEFHYRLNKYSVSIIHEYAVYHAPVASRVFAWILYPELCISDPMLRPMDGRAWLARDVPGLRWVGMVVQRQGIVRGILTRLALEGHRVPEAAFGALCKLWVVMESSSSKVREAFLQDKGIWSDGEILVVQLFLVKLDMRFSDPVLGNGVSELSRMLLAQKGLHMLWQVLTGEVELDYDKVTDILVRTYLSEDLDLDTHPWLDDEIDNGVPEELWGVLSREGWHMDGERMHSAIDMVIMEGIRRGLDVQSYYLEYVLYGYVDEEGNNVPVPKTLRRGRVTNVVEMGWPNEQTRQEALRTLKSLVQASCSEEMETDD